MSAEVSVIVVSHNTRAVLERCLAALGRSYEVIVVDTASTDGSPELVRERFPHVALVALDENVGYGAAMNAGIVAAAGEFLLLLNADAWPSQPDAVDALLGFVRGGTRVGIAGPRLVNVDGTLQPSVRGFPTRWRLATEYLFLRWLAPRTSLLNAFYGAGFDHTSVRDSEFLVGAVLLVRRALIDDVGGFDPAFFMYDDEVDLCYRAHRAGWRVVFVPSSEFVHVGGASAAAVRPEMYREQLRSHLRFVDKHHGRAEAEKVRRLLVAAMWVRAVVFGVLANRERRGLSQASAAWLRSGDVGSLLR